MAGRLLQVLYGPGGVDVRIEACEKVSLPEGMFPRKMTKGTVEQVGLDAMCARAPLRRIGDDDDLKGSALLFASAASEHIARQALAIDGGVSAMLS